MVIDYGTIDEGIYNKISFNFGLDNSKKCWQPICKLFMAQWYVLAK
jgi:hypothetical protein